MVTSELRTTEIVGFGRGLTVRSVVIGLVLLFTGTVIADLTWLYTSKGGTINAFFLPFFYIVLVNELVGRLNKKLRLSGPELVCIFPAMLINNSIKYMPKGALSGGEAVIGFVEKTLAVFGYGLNTADMADYFRRMTPSFMFPKSEFAISAWYNGLLPGQEVPWGEFIAPITYWSIYTTLTYFLCLFLAFGIYGRMWAEVEKLPFPLSLPMIFMVNNALDVDPSTNKSRWFDLKNTSIKVFWIAFFMGALLAAIPVLGEVIPPLAVYGAFAWGEQPILFEGLAALMPGAMAKGVFQVDQIALWMLLPNNVLLTCIVAYIVFGVLYQWLGVLTGVLPYNPGMEFLWNWEDIPANWYPFPYRAVGVLGMMVGLGVITLWTLRRRIADIINALKGKDIMEYGLSLRLISYFGIFVMLAILAFFIGSGAPALIAVWMLILAIIYYTALARVTSSLWWHVDDFMGTGGLAYIYPLGSALGYWTEQVPSGGNPSYEWFITGNLIVPFNNCWTLRVNGFGPGALTGFYKIAYETKTNLKDAFFAIIYIAILGSFAAFAWRVWLYYHGGGMVHAGGWSWTQWWKGGYNIWGAWSYMPFGETNWQPSLTFGATGFIIILVVYYLRGKFAWFFVDPTALAMSMAVGLEWTWLSGLVALVIKLILIRTMGLRRFESYVIPIAAGVSLGFGAPLLFAGLIEFFGVILPKFLSFYVP